MMKEEMVGKEMVGEEKVEEEVGEKVMEKKVEEMGPTGRAKDTCSAGMSGVWRQTLGCGGPPNGF